MKKKKLLIVLGLVLVLAAAFGGVAYVRLYNADKKPTTPQKTVKEESLSQKDAEKPPLQQKDSTPQKQSGTVLSCKKVTSSQVKSVLGDGYTTKVSNASEPLTPDVQVCDYSKATKQLTIVIHDYNVARMAESVQKSLKDTATITKGSVLVAVSLREKGTFQKSQSEKIANQISESL